MINKNFSNFFYKKKNPYLLMKRVIWTQSFKSLLILAYKKLSQKKKKKIPNLRLKNQLYL